jgi:hypothetical protein
LKRVAVLQSNYAPWRGQFALMASVDAFVFYDEVQFTVRDWRNRNRIGTKDGIRWLTVPVPGHSRSRRVSEVMLESPAWQAEHARILRETFRKAPHFAQLEGVVASILEGRQWQRLVDVDRALLVTLTQALGIGLEFIDSADLQLPEGRAERMLATLQQVGATHYLSGPSAREYLEPARPQFERAGIAIDYMSYPTLPAYAHVHGCYDPALSIYDVIAHVPFEKVLQR